MDIKGAHINHLKKLQVVFNHARKIGIRDADSSIFLNISEQMKMPEEASFTISSDTIYKIENIDRSAFSRTELFSIRQ